MAKKPATPNPHADQFGAVQLPDGRTIQGAEVTAKAFDLYCAHYATDEPTVFDWNAESNQERKAWADKALAAIEAGVVGSAAAVDLSNQAAIHLTAREQLGAALIDAALTECKAMEKPWHMMNADAQSEVYERITRQVKDAAADTVRLLATNGCQYLVCELESIMVKKGAKATLEIPRGGLDENVLDAVGQQVILVIGSALDDVGNIQTPRPDPDQQSLIPTGMTPHVGDQPDNGLVTGSDPED